MAEVDPFEAAFDEAIAGTKERAAPEPDETEKSSTAEVADGDADRDVESFDEGTSEDESGGNSESDSKPKEQPKQQDSPKPEPKEKPKSDEPEKAEEGPSEDEYALDIPALERSEEEKAAIAEFAKDYPEISKAFEIEQKHREYALKKLFAETLANVVGKVYEDIRPLQGTAKVVSENQHFSKIERAHPDYYELVPADASAPAKLEEWIDTQPALVKKVYKQVYNEGSADEIIELVSEYKRATGVVSSPQSTSETQPKAGARKEPPAPVKSQRTAVKTSGTDPNDFMAAFDEAAEKFIPRR